MCKDCALVYYRLRFVDCAVQNAHLESEREKLLKRIANLKEERNELLQENAQLRARIALRDGLVLQLSHAVQGWMEAHGHLGADVDPDGLVERTMKKETTENE